MSEDVVDVDDARELVGKREVRVIDIRSEEEFAEVRINASRRVDPDDVEAAIGDADEGEPDRVMLVCEDGSESGELAEKLSGDADVTYLDGGIKAWQGKGYPVAPRADEEYEGPAVKLPGAVASESEPDEDETEPEPDEDGERPQPREDETADEETAERAEEA